jgi:hypothetical protein
MHEPLSTDRQRYFQLMSLVCEDLPTKAVDTLVRKDYPAPYEQLRAARQGRRTDLPMLIDLVKAGLPDFPIPDEVLPIESAQADAPLFQK